MKNILLSIFFFAAQLTVAQDFKLEKLPDSVNSIYDEITPVPSRDGKTLYFTRVGFPEFEHTIFIDSIEQSRLMSPERYLNFLSGVYSDMAGSGVYNPVRSPYNQDVWWVSVDSSGIGAPQHPGYPLNNALPNRIIAIAPDYLVSMGLTAEAVANK